MLGLKLNHVSKRGHKTGISVGTSECVDGIMDDPSNAMVQYFLWMILDIDVQIHYGLGPDSI